ncbi:unnamed protein product [Arctogadus glacialis]
MTTSHPQPQPNDAKVNEHLARVESLEREKRAKTTVKDLLGDLRENNLINEELSDTLAFYSDLKMDFVAKHEYTQDCREFALMLHLQWSKGIPIPQRLNIFYHRVFF